MRTLQTKLGAADLEIDVEIGDADEPGLGAGVHEIRHHGAVVWNKVRDGRIILQAQHAEGEIWCGAVAIKLRGISCISYLFLPGLLREWSNKAIRESLDQQKETQP